MVTLCRIYSNERPTQSKNEEHCIQNHVDAHAYAMERCPRHPMGHEFKISQVSIRFQTCALARPSHCTGNGI